MMMMSPQRGLFQASCGDDGQDDNDDDNGDHDDADDDDDTLSPLVSPPDRASFELPRAPDIGSCNANLLSNVTPKINIIIAIFTIITIIINFITIILSNVTPKINITIVPVILVVEKINKCLQ